MDGYQAPPRSGLVRLRPGSGGSVHGDDAERVYNKQVLAELDEVLEQELHSTKSGVPLTYTPQNTRKVTDLYSKRKATPDKSTENNQPQEATSSPQIPQPNFNESNNDNVESIDLLFRVAEQNADAEYTALKLVYQVTPSKLTNFKGVGPLGGDPRATPPPNPDHPITLINREGFRIPSTTFQVQTEIGDEEWTTSMLFNLKRCVVFAIVGAFAPTCTQQHLPRYNELAPAFKASGIDAIYCVSVNDTHVLNLLQERTNTHNVIMLPDGDASFTQGMGMLVDMSQLGMGKRSWRYSMLVDNCTITKMFVEAKGPGDPFEVSDAETMLNFINPNVVRPRFVALYTSENCSSCAKAKSLLNVRGWPFEEHKLGKDTSRELLYAIAGKPTTPVVFIDGRLVGNAEDLERYFKLMG